MTRPRLGDLLVSTARVTPAQLEEALVRQKETGRRLGHTLVELGHVSEEAVAQILSQQLSVPWVSLSRVEFSRELLNLVPAELASRWMLVPIYARKTRAGSATLFVATDDPLNDKGLAEVAQHVGMTVKPMVTSSTELRSVIRIYYGVEVPPLVARALKSPSLLPIEVEIDFAADEPVDLTAVPQVIQTKSRASSRPRSVAPKGSAKPAPIPEAAPLPRDLGKDPNAEKKKSEPGRSKKKPRMLTLTLLDGTTVSLPQTGKGGGSADERLTTRDLILALDARAQGSDVKSVLSGASWESLLSTLLSVLLRKGVLADWEFVEEWEKHPGAPGAK